MTEGTKSKPKRRYAREPKISPIAADEASSSDAAAPPRETKIGRVIALLRQDDGATLEQIVEATGWQPHTARAAMTGLRKKGHTIGREQADGTSRYRIAASA